MFKFLLNCSVIIFFCISCDAQKQKTDSIKYKEFSELMGYGRNYKKIDSINHIDAKEFNLQTLSKDTLINSKKYYPLSLNSKYNLRTDTKYFFNYNSNGVFLTTIYKNKITEDKFLSFDSSNSDIIGTLFGRLELFQLIKKNETEYSFNYIQNPKDIEIYYMFGDKILIKNRDHEKITLVLYYHDKFSSFQKEFEIPYDDSFRDSKDIPILREK